MKFSVVIPLYNKASHIRETLASVLCQSHTHFEIIIVDDGSTDNGADLVTSFSDDRIKLVKQENAGVSAARNRGAAESTANYIAFLDADDEWFPWHLEELASLINLFPACGIYSLGHEIIEQGIRLKPCTYPNGFKGIVDNVLGVFSKSLSLVNSSTACVTTEAFKNSGGFPEGITRGEDVYLWIKIALRNGLAHSSRICARYNRDADNRCCLTKSSEIPYYLIYLENLILQNELGTQQLCDAKKLFSKGLFFTAAGYRLIGNTEAIKRLRKMETVQSSFLLTNLLLVLLFTPLWGLKSMKLFRHRRA